MNIFMNISFTIQIVLPQNSNTFLDWRIERVTRAMGQNSLTASGNTNLSFRLAHDQIVHIKTAAKQVFVVAVCAIFELGGTTKHLMTRRHTGNREFCFPSTLSALCSSLAL